MGLTESNQSKSGFWGPAKSKSTPHFADGRSYEGRPRQAATLPARPVTNNLNSHSGREENLLSTLNTRPPDRLHRRDRSLQREHVGGKEIRLTRPITMGAVDRRKRQSDPLLDFSPPLNLAFTNRAHHTLIDKDSHNYAAATPQTSPKSPSRHRPTAIYIADDQVHNIVSRRSRSRPRNTKGRESSSSSSIRTHQEDIVSKEKETQTFPTTTLLTYNPPEEPQSSYSVPYREKSEHRHRSRHKKKSKKVSEKISCSVPTTPSEIESDPYICLYYGNSLYREADNERKFPRNSKEIVPWRPVFSEACLYIPRENDSVIKTPATPESKRSQILIKVDSGKVGELDNNDSMNGNQGAVEVCSNVWFESSFKGKDDPRKNIDCSKETQNGHVVKDKYVLNPQVTSNEVKQEDTNKVEHCPSLCDVNYCDSVKTQPLGDEQPKRNESGNSFNNSKLNGPIYKSHHASNITRSVSLHDNLKHSYMYSLDRSKSNITSFDTAMMHSENRASPYRHNNINDNIKQTHNEEGEIFDESHETIKKRPLSCVSLKSMSQASETEITEDSDKCNLISEDKENDAHSNGNLISENGVALKTREDDIKDISIGESVSPCITPVTNEYGDTELKSQFQYTGQHFFTLNDCVDRSNFLPFEPPFLRGVTLPLSPSHPHPTTESDLWFNESQNERAEMLRRKTIHCVDVGTFPILRLPKLESQPRLVDVLRRANSKGGKEDSINKNTLNEDVNGKEGFDNHISSSVPLTAEIETNSFGKFSHLDENILYITEDLPNGCVVNEKLNNSILRNSILQLSVNRTNICEGILQNEFVNNENNSKIELNANSDLHDTISYRSPEKFGESCYHSNPLDYPTVKKRENDLFGVTSFMGVQDAPQKVNKKLHHNSETLPSNGISPLDRKLKCKSIDCNLTCHEQCQNVVSLDCKATFSPDSDSLFEDDDNLEDSPNDSPIEPHEENRSIRDENSYNDEDGDPQNYSLEEDEGLDDICLKEEEEEKHEEEKLEKEIKEEEEMLTLKKLDISTLRRTVHRIQSQTVASSEIEEWVQKCPSNNVGLQIAKENDGGYRGCLRIHLNLSRPINIVAGTRPPSIYDILQEDRTLEKTLTSFYMPRDAVKAIHITSKTTTREVIVALLRKFKVVDNPQKFALYERTYDTGNSVRAKLCRLPDNECPLVLAIAWNAQGISNKRLVLQENDTADIQWDAFSLPELDNFLRILDREEGEYKNQIRDKYTLLRKRIQNQLSRYEPIT